MVKKANRTLKADKSAKLKSRKPTSKKYKIIIIKDRCKGCKLCVSYCPTETLEMSNEMNVKGYYIPHVVSINRCKGCDLCSKYCPDFAIFSECSDDGKDTQDFNKKKLKKGK
jgi:2-oxoglutarate ferredoxin oxidoreductase subunit delta